MFDTITKDQVVLVLAGVAIGAVGCYATQKFLSNREIKKNTEQLKQELNAVLLVSSL